MADVHVPKGEIKIPGIGPVKKSWAIAGAGLTAGIVGYAYYVRKKSSSSAAAAASTDTSSQNIDPATGFPYGSAEDQAALAAQSGTSSSIDPATGFLYGSAADQAALGGFSGGGGVVGTGGGSTGTGTGDTGGTGTGDTGGGGTGVGDPPVPVPVPGPTKPTTNAGWASEVENGLHGTGLTKATVTAAVNAYLAGRTLTAAQATIIQVAIAEFGPPPQGAPPIKKAPPPPVTDKGVRHVANGTQSLDQVAKERHTTTSHIIAVTENSTEINTANRRKFEHYVAGGTNKRMPAGLVYYTSNK